MYSFLKASVDVELSTTDKRNPLRAESQPLFLSGSAGQLHPSGRSKGSNNFADRPAILFPLVVQYAWLEGVI